MDRSSFYLKNIPESVRLESAIWPAVASVFLLTGYASSLGHEHQIWRGTVTEKPIAASRAAAKSARLLSTSKRQASTQRPLRASTQVVNRDSLAARFVGPLFDPNDPPSTSAIGHAQPALGPLYLTLEPSEDKAAKSRGAAHSSIGVFSLGDTKTVIGSAADIGSPQQHVSQTVSPRDDLLNGVPGAYATLAARIATEEGVDPNWVLAIMRAENAAFDRKLISPAGAIGLMQIMPQIGTAFGATDLTEPEQNIRAGTRFLHLLISKYRNPVLIASAYNAGEPRVDAGHSLPLIRETADYVTRVVGYYTGMPAAVPSARTAISSQTSASAAGHSGRADRAKSPMLVFSVAERSAALGPAHRERDPIVAAGPVKIVKEEVVR